MAAFDFFGSVPQTILYSNTKLAAVKLLGDGARTRAKLFAELHRTVEDHAEDVLLVPPSSDSCLGLAGLEIA